MFSKYKNVVLGVLVAVGAIASVTLATQSDAAVQNAPDCSNNSIIKCGAMTQDTLRAKYAASPEIKSLYGQLGISSAMINGPLYTGQVNKDGTVEYNGKVVATNAQSVGRFMDNGTGCKGSPFAAAGKTFYKGSTQCRFGYTSEVAYIMLSKDGQFLGAIIKGCGNPIPATPVKPPAPKPTPAYSCVEITKSAISRTEFQFNAKTSVSGGASTKSYAYNFGDGTTKTVTSGAVNHTYAKDGTYTVTLTPTFVVNGKDVPASSATCKTTVTVTPVPVVPPVKPPVKPPVVKPAEVSCTALTLQTISATSYNLHATASATPGLVGQQQAGSISGYTYTVKASDGSVIKTINQAAGLPTQVSDSGNFTLTPGTYTAQVVVHSNVGDKTGTQCTVMITVPAPNQIVVCRLSDWKIVTINETDFDSSKYSKSQADCSEQACDTTTYTIVTINKSQENDSRYTTDTTNCHPPVVPPVTPPVTPPVVVTPPATPVTPPAVTTLPETGAADVVMPLLGVGSLIAAVSYYVASRRALLG